MWLASICSKIICENRVQYFKDFIAILCRLQRECGESTAAESVLYFLKFAKLHLELHERFCCSQELRVNVYFLLNMYTYAHGCVYAIRRLVLQDCMLALGCKQCEYV